MLNAFIKPIYQDIKLFVLDTLFPITCISCGADGVLICLDCKSIFKKLEHQLCIVCQKQAVFGLTHSKCQSPYTADGLISFYNYHDEKIAKIIIAGKYKFIPNVFAELGQIIALQLISPYPHILISNFTIVPIPLHRTRMKWRGFNQSQILAGTISHYLNIPCDNVLVRCKITKTQKDLNKEERKNNLKDAFRLSPKADIKNKKIILIDDVTTTGATLQQAAKILKQKGASKVICLTVARD